ncbi:hypothetical protein J6590_025928 [Homalodisca vitripennis]|nr:hypothetical protein J6590_025928 [Homalodisca vitripennis]
MFWIQILTEELERNAKRKRTRRYPVTVNISLDNTFQSDSTQLTIRKSPQKKLANCRKRFLVGYFDKGRIPRPAKAIKKDIQ